jgi:hypothetical protein
MDWCPDWQDGKKETLTAKEQVKKNIETAAGSYLAKKCEECHELEVKNLWDLNRRFMDALPEYFFDGRIMSAPVNLINGQNVSAMSRVFKLEYADEFTQNCKGYMLEEDFKNMVVQDLAAEFKKEAIKKDKEDLVICPYIPIQIIYGLDANTFQPKIGFKTRYGLMKK